ncbi:4-(cytidine 5'-diphospho)-2-C-methyl-D-erythritol kinase [Rhizobiaceae bacterium BDR2-2]|uniref:4-diphosphocytidyl-2-C-methyl-D-erythritol kinase n=1 Tax=Ectorhizobium quercum TaxID=2965071 RepID=A0AAE3MXJ7_9HYPH|nr:4-(cytidine 5'-diphospho)-2-C-methyl-D-erythritol kinase [Ectorhizobium quercum]MCX8996326.1 4-(cytidine 5'-diphospho)-2-C-methyl-D-erythritol kinase [Ectorhizobium quercum]MCX8998635.1 4-(cytidine 5'-diphospho)-2-C-methyl-D-erythritol kinase [Ectorhizobium quercum]
MDQTAEIAPAKINLALHVIGQRADGYHLIDSLVTFADRGDRVSARIADADAFMLSGPFSGGLETDGNNLTLKARDLLRATVIEAGGAAPPVALHLEKNLPVAAGIGGGSADAAATLRALMRLWNVESDAEALGALALRLGADVPMCLAGRPAVARGIGEKLTPAPSLPSLHLLLVNPLKPVSTPDIFRRLDRRDNPPMDALPGSFSLPDWSEFLAGQRNDLEAPARQCVPEIGIIQTLLRLTGAQLCRMSGSGATCFGLYESREAARAAERNLRTAQPGWFVEALTTVSGDET